MGCVSRKRLQEKKNVLVSCKDVSCEDETCWTWENLSSASFMDEAEKNESDSLHFSSNTQTGQTPSFHSIQEKCGVLPSPEHGPLRDPGPKSESVEMLFHSKDDIKSLQLVIQAPWLCLSIFFFFTFTLFLNYSKI